MDNDFMRWIACVFLLLVTACASTAPSEDGEARDCEPSRTEFDPLLGAEVEADGPDGAEGWALVFAQWTIVPGEKLTIPVGDEAKIVWRLTGEGDVSFRAIGPDGEVQGLTWGPDKHAGSNWARPGDEWGTGWILPSKGCWTLEATRGSAVLSIAAEAT